MLKQKSPGALYKIVLPTAEEAYDVGSLDVMDEESDYKLPGLQHRYPDTALIMATDICAGFCRYCFRKRKAVAPLNDDKIENFDDIIDYIERHTEISNVLLSGGDPFTLGNNKLLSLLEPLANIEHLNYIRIGTKILAYLPQRITEEPEFVEKLKELNKKKLIKIIVHFDHDEEFSKETTKAIEMLNNAGLTLYDQTVLLKGINDDIVTMTNLLDQLTAHKIIPYYIFQAMPVKQSLHLQVSLLDAMSLMNEISKTRSPLENKFKFIIPNELGKMECIGFDDNYLYFKHHKSVDSLKTGELFKVPCDKKRTWFSKEEIIYLKPSLNSSIYEPLCPTSLREFTQEKPSNGVFDSVSNNKQNVTKAKQLHKRSAL